MEGEKAQRKRFKDLKDDEKQRLIASAQKKYNNFNSELPTDWLSSLRAILNANFSETWKSSDTWSPLRTK